MNHRLCQKPSAPALRLRSLRLRSGQAGQACFLLVLVSVACFFLFNSARAQEPREDALLRRVAQLEEKLAKIEAESQQLRERLAALEHSNGTARATSPVLVASAQSSPGQRPASPPPEAVPQRVALGAEIRFRPESRSELNEKTALNNMLFQRIRLNARLRLTENVTGFVQLQDSRLWGQEVSPTSNESNVDLHQAYLQVDRFLYDRLSLRVGRQELQYGNDRLIGPANWDNVGRSFDAWKLTYASPRWSSDFFFSRLNDRRNAARGDGSQDFIGWYTRIGKSGSRIGIEPYVLYLRDGLTTRGERNALRLEPTRLVTLGFRHFASSAGGFGYDIENAYQVGQNGPDSHRAAALAAVGRYRSARRLSPEFGFEYDFATGDANARDGRSGEFNNLFPTNHIHYGYADYLGWRNMQDFKPYFAFAPRPNVRAELSYHRFFLVESRGPWKNAGGRVLGFDPTGRSGTDLGHEVDLTLSFPLYEQVKMLAGYSVFIPGRFARATQGPQTASFGYLQTLVTF